MGLYTGALFLSVVSMISDLLFRKVPNEVITALGVHLFGCTLLLQRNTAELICIGILAWICLFPFYMLRAIGAGDVKLLCLLLPAAGKERLFSFLLWFAVCAGVLSAAMLVRGGGLRQRFLRLVAYCKAVFYTGRGIPYLFYEEERQALSWETGASVHLTVPIVMSLMLGMGGVY